MLTRFFVAPDALEVDSTIDFRKDGVVPAHADVLARMDSGAELADDDRTRACRLTREELDAATLSVGVTPVACAALSLFMRHE
jgi:gluconate kinase